MHIFFGLADLRKWNFLKGNKAFGDLTRIDGLKAYLRMASGDWSHMLHAVPYLVQIYNVGTQQNQTDVLEDYDDAQEVFTDMEISDEVAEQLAAEEE